MNRKWPSFTLACAAAAILGGCGGPNLTAEQWEAIETRPVDGNRDEVLRAAAGVMLDEGFMFTLSDSAAGLLGGERIGDYLSADRYARSGGMRKGGRSPWVDRVVFWVRQDGPGRCAMRAQFVDSMGQRISSQERVTQIWNYVQQRMLKYAPHAAAGLQGARP